METAAKQRALDAALAQIDRAFSKGSKAVLIEPTDEPELTPEEEAAEAERQAAWNALSKEEQDARWAAWEAEHAPNGLPF